MRSLKFSGLRPIVAEGDAPEERPGLNGRRGSPGVERHFDPGGSGERADALALPQQVGKDLAAVALDEVLDSKGGEFAADGARIRSGWRDRACLPGWRDRDRLVNPELDPWSTNSPSDSRLPHPPNGGNGLRDRPVEDSNLCGFGDKLVDGRCAVDGSRRETRGFEARATGQPIRSLCSPRLVP